MSLDEVGTLRALKAHRKQLFDPLLTTHQGRIIKTTGDGVLVEFPSAVEAVASAVAIQRTLLARNASIQRDRRIEVRIGINVGDVIIDGDDIHGDGVNIAARLEALSEPGGICISGTAYDQVRDKLPFAFADRGEQMVKNIPHPVRVYALGADAVAALGDIPASIETQQTRRPLVSIRIWRTAVGIAAALLLVAGAWFAIQSARNAPSSSTALRLSIVVLPFANLSGDPAQDYFADGITEDITTDLSRIRGSFVIARNTAYTFKGKPVDMKQIAAELAVRYGLEGSVQRAGSQVRVNAQLINVETGGHLLWADRFDGDMSDLPRLQDLVTSRLANSLNVQLVDAESRRGLREQSGDSDAIDLVMRASAILHKGFSPENGKRARELFEQALSQDGQNLDAMVGLAHVDATDILFGWSDNPTGAAKRSENYVASVLAADPDYAQAYRVRAEILLGEARPGEMLLAAQRAAALDQNMPDAYHLAGITKIYLGRSAEAFSDFDRAIALSPRDPLLGLRLHGIGFAHLFLGHYDQAIDWELRAIEANDHRWIPYASLAAAYALTGRDTEARVAVANAKRSNQYLSIRWLKSNKWSDNPTFLQQRERWYEGLRMAGLPEE